MGVTSGSSSATAGFFFKAGGPNSPCGYLSGKYGQGFLQARFFWGGGDSPPKSVTPPPPKFVLTLFFTPRGPRLLPPPKVLQLPPPQKKGEILQEILTVSAKLWLDSRKSVYHINQIPPQSFLPERSPRQRVWTMGKYTDEMTKYLES